MRSVGGLIHCPCLVYIRDLEEQILQFNIIKKKKEKTPFFLDLKLVGKIGELVSKIKLRVPQLFIITEPSP